MLRQVSPARQQPNSYARSPCVRPLGHRRRAERDSWHRSDERPVVQSHRRRLERSALARRSPAPIQLQLATLTDKAPEGDPWLHEIKLDGYRMACCISDGLVQVIS